MKPKHTVLMKKIRGTYHGACCAQGCRFSVASAFQTEAQAQADFHEQKARR